MITTQELVKEYEKYKEYFDWIFRTLPSQEQKIFDCILDLDLSRICNIARACFIQENSVSSSLRNLVNKGIVIKTKLESNY